MKLRAMLCLAGALIVTTAAPRVEAGIGAWEFVRGDVDGNATLELADGVQLLEFLFLDSSPGLLCVDAGDVNDDGQLTIIDPVLLLSVLFVPGSPNPPAPFPSCGFDPTPDPLGCVGPLSGCDEADLPPNLLVAFANDATEDSLGVRMHPNAEAITAGNFDELVFAMRPMTIQVGSASGSVEVTASGSNLELYALDGTPISLPASFPAASLPTTVLVNATDVGPNTLTAVISGGIPDVVEFNVGLFPGLVGGELSAYPWFETVQTINDDEEVLTALDPNRYPDRIDQPFDVYVVAHRTPAEWAANNTLLDVTGGVESATLVTGSIQDNVFDAWLSGLDGGTEVALGYDLVLDFGQDGTLDPGDLIDGLEYGRAGFYIARNLNLPGPLATTSVTYSGGTFLGQKTYYPTSIGTLGELPLVVISHGNGHQYTWYDYLGDHLASHGYIVMSHQNNTGPGPSSAATTTLNNTQYLLANLGTIAGGALQSHVDDSNIAFVGHSRGGEGVVIAYDRLVDGSFTSPQFDVDDIRVVSSISPTMFFDVNTTDPNSVNYHLLYGAADGDVAGGPGNSWPFQVYQAAEGPAQATYVQGASHNDFNCCGFGDGTGPALIGRPAAQVVAKSYFLALFQHYMKDDPSTRDFLTRQFDGFRPSGIGSNVVVANQYRDAATVPNDFIETYQTQTSTGTSSSGGTVTFDVSNITEGILRDGNSSFSWLTSDPMNGMTQAFDAVDQTRGTVFDWSSPSFYEFEVVGGLQDFSDNVFLSLRACQGTRHPETVSLAGELDFTVTLRDTLGTSSSINFGSFATITRPYQRTGLGSGAGWANEFNTVRFRLTDFETDGTGIDLSQIEAIRLEFGSGFGSIRGRLGLDDVHVTVGD